MRIWYLWWQATNIVKVIPHEANGGSADSMAMSATLSNTSRSSNRRGAVTNVAPEMTVGESAPQSNSNIEAQFVLGEYSV